MRITAAVLFAAIALALITALSLTLAPTRADAAAKVAPQLWEYHCVLPPGALPTESENKDPTIHEKVAHGGGKSHPAELVLNHLGSKGWELVTIDPNNGHYCFKRPN